MKVVLGLVFVFFWVGGCVYLFFGFFFCFSPKSSRPSPDGSHVSDWGWLEAQPESDVELCVAAGAGSRRGRSVARSNPRLCERGG